MSAQAYSGAATLRQLVDDASRALAEAGIEQPRLEAQVLLADAVNATRTQIIAGTVAAPDAGQLGRFRGWIQRRERREPFAWVRGIQEFYGIPFLVGPGVLVPRPETELMVEAALEFLAGRPAARVVDVCTGSGCVGIATAIHRPAASVLFIDLSAAAIEIAGRNAVRHGIQRRCAFMCASLLKAVRGGLDLILCNPPYISSGAIECLPPEVRHEPRIALDGGPTGLELPAEVIRQAAGVLAPGGALMMEVGIGQIGALKQLAERAGFLQTRAMKDLAGIDRLLVAEIPA
ncbi:MAG: peptide chain release factor N(5)-glutamine methyltransferase [Armatimonadetes bacterium]|nr:peptide chain release factor N(5)-glutamine methyltransferase [Armatimonadota bacterium]MDE2207611.1 peptide chain release factor N(5)-glutamine methyltransferase [Armatimonadota bacterium]